MKGGVRLYITQQWDVWDYIQWRVVCDFTSHHTEKCETTFNEGWCVTLHHITLWSVVCDCTSITSHWEVWDYIQWRVVCDFTSHHTEKCETTFNEGWCVTLHHITLRSVRLHSMKGGVWLYITSHCEGWCVTVHHITLRSVRLHSMKGGVWLYITSHCEAWCVTVHQSHHTEKCETIFNEGWCATLHHITLRSVRLHSMKGGVQLYITSHWEVWDYIQWRVVCDFTSHHTEKCEDYIQWRVVCDCTSHHTEKCETTFNEGWCVTVHHITLWRVVCDCTSHHTAQSLRN